MFEPLAGVWFPLPEVHVRFVKHVTYICAVATGTLNDIRECTANTPLEQSDCVELLVQNRLKGARPFLIRQSNGLSFRSLPAVPAQSTWGWQSSEVPSHEVDRALHTISIRHHEQLISVPGFVLQHHYNPAACAAYPYGWQI
jgi:hypothetical protein